METIEVDGQEFDIETISDAVRNVIIGRAPVAVMDELDLRRDHKPAALVARLRHADRLARAAGWLCHRATAGFQA